jgi:hypothetical protein
MWLLALMCDLVQNSSFSLRMKTMTSKTLSKSEMATYLLFLGVTCEYSYGVVSQIDDHVTIRMQMNTPFIPGDALYETLAGDGLKYKVSVQYFKIV